MNDRQSGSLCSRQRLLLSLTVPSVLIVLSAARVYVCLMLVCVLGLLQA